MNFRPAAAAAVLEVEAEADVAPPAPTLAFASSASGTFHALTLASKNPFGGYAVSPLIACAISPSDALSAADVEVEYEEGAEKGVMCAAKR